VIIEIRKTGFVNKGAELMLRAIVEQVKRRYPDAILVMAPSPVTGSRPFDRLVAHGFLPKAWFWKFGIQWGDFAAFFPAKLRRTYGLVLDKEIDVVLDAAGFSYSDQWGIDGSKELARSSRRWKKHSAKVILLPQALGPYENKEIQAWVKQWAGNVDLIFAREIDSYKHLTSVVGEQKNIKLFPDFTNLVKGTLPNNYDPTNKRIALVPNYRMVDKTHKAESEAYLPFMIRCAKYLVERSARPYVLVHEGAKDKMLAEKISEAVGGIPIVIETDPLHIKGILGTCDATIGSRYHGLVSALSQGVPSLATGWSHKYIRLFEEYGFDEGVVTVLDSDEVVQKKIDRLLNSETVEPLKQQLREKSEDFKKRSEEMWNLVFAKIDEVDE
jgi:polysaccharide pyruvyl transferase WcaK-like protein